MSKKLPIVAIVGRANVGKSSLFNAILERREAIVANEPGTTRDSIIAKASIWLTPQKDKKQDLKIKRVIASDPDPEATDDAPDNDRYDFWLVDTAGIKDPDDDFEFTIQEQIQQAADSADVIWVVVEANVPITEEDRHVAKMALKSGKPVFLVVNKMDKAKGVDPWENYQRLGIKPVIGTSVPQRRGIDELLDRLVQIIPHASLEEDSDRLRIALLGRPNVGKSALFNTLAKKQQAIVADRAGTTRDINRAVVKYEGREIEIMDTAGIRRSGKIEVGIEKFSVIRSIAAIEQADVCFLLMDANELNVQLDQKIAGMIKEAGKGLVLVVSKWDIAEDKNAFTRDEIAPQIASNYEFVPWAPLIFTSSITGQNVTKLFELATKIDEARHTRIKTVELNRWLKQVIDRHPPAGLKNRAPKLNYMVQEDDNPTPAFKIFGAHTRYLHWSYKRYMERNMRETFGFEGTPVQLWFIEKHITHKSGQSPTRGEYRPPRRLNK
jgi:GTP-binding protein